MARLLNTVIEEPRQVIKREEINQVIQAKYHQSYISSEQEEKSFNFEIEKFWSRITKMILGLDGEEKNFKRLLKHISNKIEQVQKI